jgi:hypothetical protein
MKGCAILFDKVRIEGNSSSMSVLRIILSSVWKWHAGIECSVTIAGASAPGAQAGERYVLIKTTTGASKVFDTNSS